MKTGQVFVSHTADMARFPEGRSFVQAALDAVGRAGLASVDMRYFAAVDRGPADYCRARVVECEIFVAVVGFRYGTLVPGLAVSYTELEFDAASGTGLPRLVFLLEPGGLPPDLADADRGRVDRFRQRLRDAGLLARTFTSSDGLELEVFHALSLLADGRHPSGEPGVQGVRAGGLGAATRTLPRDIASFTGRESEVRQLVDAVASGVIGIHAIGGMAGIGKTAFAVHAAHQLAARFPDGQIFLRLHAHTPGQRPVDPADALASLLLTAGVAPQQIPPGVEERARLWRDHLVGKQMLFLLDDATGHDQILPLLPGTAESLVLVTTRRRLTALEDAQAISLDVLPAAEAAAMLIRLSARLGLSPDEKAVQEIVRLCGYLPLAIGMLARQMHHHAAWTAAELADDLAAARDRLDLMQAEDLSVAAAFDLSYRTLHPGQQRLFRRLGLFPGTDTDVYASAALDGIDPRAARSNLDGLYDRYLIAEPTHGRYCLHDLIGQHARSLSATDPVTECDAAIGRLLDYLLHVARAADRHLARHAPTGVSAEPFAPPAYAPELQTRDEALFWMEAERLNLHTAVGYAASHDRPGHAAAISAAMHGFLRGQGHWNQALILHRAALEAARQNSNHLAEAGALIDLGTLQLVTGDYTGATGSHEHALALYRSLGNRLGEANALNHLGTAQRATRQYQAAKANHERALQLHRELGNKLGEANSHNNLGILHHAHADHHLAAACYERALELFHDLSNPAGEAQVLNNMGELSRVCATAAEAHNRFAQALAIATHIASLPEEARAREGIGRYHLQVGETALADRYLQQAQQIYRQIGSPRAAQAQRPHAPEG
jgi:tetratricopeptide (TPR) repeat protein